MTPRNAHRPSRAWLIGLLLACCTAQGCAGETASSDDEVLQSTTGADDRSAAGFPLTITDWLDREVTLEAPPRRIVSLAPRSTELVYALGAEDRLVGVTTVCDYPPEAKSKPKVGGFAPESLNMERVLGLEPDLVLAAGAFHRRRIGELERLDVPVVALGAESFDELYRELALLGEITGREVKAAEIIEQMQQRVDRVRSIAKTIPSDDRVSVYYQVWDHPLMAAGRDSYLGRMIELCGGRNIFDDLEGDYLSISAETVLARDPQVILAPTSHGEQITPEQFADRPGWRNLQAVKNGRVQLIDGDLVSRCGPRLAPALEAMARAIYPEHYAELNSPTSATSDSTGGEPAP